MKLPELTPRTIESDPYRTVVLTNGSLIFAECNGSHKQEVAEEIALRCNTFDDLLAAAIEFVEGEGNCKSSRAALRAAIAKARGEA